MPVSARYSTDELRDMLEHVAYEIWMLNETAALLQQMKRGVVQYAVLESFCMHARSLTEFLYRRPRAKDASRRLSAWHYDPDWTRTRTAALGGDPPVLDDTRERVNGWVAHLMDVRVRREPTDARWDVANIHQALLPAIHLFSELPVVQAMRKELTERLAA